MLQNSFRLKTFCNPISDIIIIPANNVEKKTTDGYRLVNVNEVDEEGTLRGAVIKAIIEKGIFTDMKLFGGQISSYRLCDTSSCDKTKLTFSIQDNAKYSTTVNPQYAIMIGKLIHTYAC